MNSEKQIAQTILDAQKMREESYVPGEKIPGVTKRHQMEGQPTRYPGEYKLDIETCLKTAGEKYSVTSNMWYLLSLAMHWWNDIQLWAEDVLAGKDIADLLLSKDDIEAIVHDEGLDAVREKFVAEAEAANAEIDAAEIEEDI